MQPIAKERFLALDVFRGMTICLMIIVNTPGNGATTFAPLEHAHWNGFTPTDPCISFIHVCRRQCDEFCHAPLERNEYRRCTW